jgi:mono/diheme cytochrome c family protein
MWNHSGIMTATAVEVSKERPSITAQDLADITAYAREVRGLPPPPATPSIPADLEQVRLAGKQYFDANCQSCHRLGMALDQRLANRTYLDIAAGLWNHLPKMIVVPTPAASQMRATIAYVWELQYLGPTGNRVNGARLFERKNCAQCHIDAKTGASTMTRGEKLLTPYSMIALGWKHERQMQAPAPRQRIRWSSLSSEDIADLIVYLNSRP